MTRNPNKYGLMAIAAILLDLIPALCQAPQPQYGPWMPLRDGAQNGVQIAFKLYPDGTQYFKLQNTYKVPVTLTCQFSFITKSGQRQTDSGCGATNLAPGAQATSGGMVDMGVASVDTSSLTSKIKLIGAAPVAPNTETIAPNAGVELSTPGDAPPNGCKLGEKRPGVADGEYTSRVYISEESAVSSPSCPAVKMNGTLIQKFQLIERDVFAVSVVKQGVVVQCKYPVTSTAPSATPRCVTSAEAKKYPKRTVRTNMHTMGGVGVRG